MQSVLQTRESEPPPVRILNWTIVTEREFLQARELSESEPLPKLKK